MGVSEKYKDQKAKISLPYKVAKVTQVGDDYVSLLTEKNEIIYFTINAEGLSKKFYWEEVPKLLKSKKVVSIKGYNCTYYLTQSGELYAMGDNDYGQLGIGHFQRRNYPVKVKNLNKVKQFFILNNARLLALTADGKVFSWGCSKRNESNFAWQLGQDPADDLNIPTPIPHLKNKFVDKIFYESDYIIAITRDKKVYFWGNNLENPFKSSWDFIYQPKEILDLKTYQGGIFNKGIRNLFRIGFGAGVFILTNDGKLYAKGNNSQGQLGIGTFKDVKDKFEMVKFK